MTLAGAPGVAPVGGRRRAVMAALIVVTAMAAAFALKRSYSHASADSLRWILSPTTWLVEKLTASPFVWESGAGYVSRDHMMVITPACAGVNFLLIAFAMLVLGFVRPSRRAHANVAVLAASAGAAYVAAIFANAIRIAVAVAVHDHHLAAGFLTPARMHLLVGIAVYLGMLVALLAVASRIAHRRFSTLHFVAWPAACYLAGTVLVPLLHGAAARDGFWTHALLVTAASAAFFATVLAIHTARRRS